MIRANSCQTVPGRPTRTDNYLRHKEFQPDFDLCHSCHPCNSRHPDYPCPPRSGDWERRRPARFPFHFPPRGTVYGNKKNKIDNKTTGEQNPQTTQTIPDNSFEETTQTTRDNSFKVRRPTGRRLSKKRTIELSSGRCDFPVAPQRMECGRGEKDKQERPAGVVTSDK